MLTAAHFLQPLLQLRARVAEDRGASFIEYVLVVSLIAVAVIAAVALFGGNLSNAFGEAGSGVGNLP